jgi:hypothetical protein
MADSFTLLQYAEYIEAFYHNTPEIIKPIVFKLVNGPSQEYIFNSAGSKILKRSKNET